jgi:hypothetical protein
MFQNKDVGKKRIFDTRRTRDIGGTNVKSVAKLSVVLCLLISIWSKTASAQPTHLTISFSERLAYQKAIEGVFWKHTIWPAENPQPKPALNAVMPQSVLQLKAGFDVF